MSTRTPLRSWDSGRVLERVLRAPARLQTYRNLLYLALTFPLGVLYFNLFVVGVSVGLSLAVFVVGVGVLVALLAAATELAAIERAYTRRLLDVEIPDPPPEAAPNLRTRCKRLVTDSRTWKAAVYLLSTFVFGSAVFGLLSSLFATAGSFLLAPLYYERARVAAFGPIPTETVTLDVLFGWDSLLVGLTTTFRVGSWQIETLSGALLVSALGVVVLFASLQVSNALAAAWGRYARAMLTTPSYRDRR